MNTIRPVRSRAFRPNLSIRYQYLRRGQSTTTTPAVEPVHTPPPLPASPTFAQRNRWPIVFSTLAIILGLGVGNVAANAISPPAMPAAGSHEDAVLMADLNRRIDEEFKVKVLRGKCLGVAKQLRGEEGGWVEILPCAERTRGGLTDALQGAKGLGVERIFWDRGNASLVAVVWFGGSVSGWPGVTHGGVIATSLTEKLALAATLAQRRKGAGISAAATPQRMPGTGNHARMFAPAVALTEPTELKLVYKKPTYANNFYTIRVQPHYADGVETASSAAGQQFEASLEQMNAKVNVTAIGTFLPVNTVEAIEQKLVGGATQTYAEFKQWLWPSRQKASIS